MATQEERLQFRMEANVVQMEKALARAEAQVVRAANKIDRDFTAANRNVERNVSRAAREVEKGTEAMGRFGKITGNQRFMIQNTAAQFGDMAVQIGGGTSALTVLGQQLPQILGPLGTLGALLGVAAAVAFPLINALGLTSDKAVSFGDRLKALNDAIQDYRDYAGEAEMPTEKLAEKYGTATEAARTFLQALRDVSNATAVTESTATATDIASTFGSLGGATSGQVSGLLNGGDVEARRQLQSIASQFAATFDDTARQGLIEQQNALQKTIETAETLNDTVGVTAEKMEMSKEQAVGLLDIMARLGEAKTADDLTQAFADLTNYIQTAYPVMAEMPAAAKELLDQVAQAGQKTAELAGGATNAGSALSGAAAQASRIADELGRAVNNAIALSNQSVDDLEVARINYDFRDDPRAKAAALARQRFDASVGDTTGADPTVLAVIEKRRQAYVSEQVEIAKLTEQTQEWIKAQNAADKKSDAGAKKLATAVAGSDDQILKDIQALNAETEIFQNLAAGADEYGHALGRARKEAEMLQGLRNKGVNITPELQQQVKDRADEWYEAAEANSKARESYEEMKDAALSADDVRIAVSDMFEGMLTDAENAKDHMVGFISNLLNQVLNNMMAGPTKILGDAATSFITGMLPSFGGAGATSGSGRTSSLLPALQGARAGGGPVNGGMPYLVNENTPNSEVFVPGQSGAILNVQQAQAALRASTAPLRSEGPRVIYVPQPYVANVAADDDGSIFARMGRVSRDTTAQGMSIQNRTMPGRIAEKQRRGIKS